MTLKLQNVTKNSNLIQKFKSRQDQKQVQQALVYLKLKQFCCPTKKAIIFARKKQKTIDGTVQRDGPASYKKLMPLKPQQQLQNGWLRGKKLKYQSATSFNHHILHSASDALTRMTRFNSLNRLSEQKQRKARTQSAFTINLHKRKQTIEKIAAIKQNVMIERENNQFVMKFKGFQLTQMTRFYSQDIKNIDTQGLIVKAGVFDTCLNDSRVQYVVSDQYALNVSTKSFSNSVDGAMGKKRNEILSFKKLIDQANNQSDFQQQNKKQGTFFKRSSSIKLGQNLFNFNQQSQLVQEKKLRMLRTNSQIKKRTQPNEFDSKLENIIKKQHLSKVSSQVIKQLEMANKNKLRIIQSKQLRQHKTDDNPFQKPRVSHQKNEVKTYAQ